VKERSLQQQKSLIGPHSGSARAAEEEVEAPLILLPRERCKKKAAGRGESEKISRGQEKQGGGVNGTLKIPAKGAKAKRDTERDHHREGLEGRSAWRCRKSKTSLTQKRKYDVVWVGGGARSDWARGKHRREDDAHNIEPESSRAIRGL